MSRAGVASARYELSISDTAWNTENASSFEADPKRLHRLRMAANEELDTVPKDITYADVPVG